MQEQCIDAGGLRDPDGAAIQRHEELVIEADEVARFE